MYQDAINAALARGAVVVVAAGNQGGNADLYAPGNCAGVITVAATDTAGNLASYSKTGTVVDVTAPGGTCALGACGPNGILSTSNQGSATPGNFIHETDAGTSYAAPHVAGVASLILSAKNLAPFQVQALLETGTTPTPNCTGCAHGRINAGTALQGVANMTPSQVGSLDLVFGTGGSVIIPLPPNYTTSAPAIANHARNALGETFVAFPAIKADGTRNVALARVKPDGQFDTAFGPAGGLVILDMSTLCGGAGKSDPEALAIQADGRILVSANTTPRAGHCVARLNPGGTLDSGFGVAGIAKAAYASDSYSAPAGSQLAVHSDGRIYVLRRSCAGTSAQVARFTSNGAVDAQFALPLNASDCGTSGGLEMSLLADGSFLLTGHYDGDAENFTGVWLRKYSIAGALDGTFASNTGRFAFAAGTARSGASFKGHLTRVQPSGIYVLAALTNTPTFAANATTANPLGKSAVVFKVSAAGVLVNAFGVGGYVLRADLPDPRPDPYGSFHAAVGLIVDDAESKILAVGAKQAFRLASDSGAVDTQFGLAGRIVLDFGSFANAAHALAPSAGRVLIAGTVTTGTNVVKAYVARFVSGDTVAPTGCYVDDTGACGTAGSFGLGNRTVGSEGQRGITFTNKGSTPITVSRVFERGAWRMPVLSDNAPDEFMHVSDDCGDVVPGNGSCTINIAFKPASNSPQDRTGWLFINTDTTQGNFKVPLTGIAAATGFTLQVSKGPVGTGAGLVSSSPTGIDCGSACTSTFNSGATVTLTANAAAGSVFLGWSGDCTGSTTTCMVTMSAARNVTATFNASAPVGTGSAPVHAATTYFGNSADERAWGVSAANGSVFIVGTQTSGAETEGFIARFPTSFAAGASRDWEHYFSGRAGEDELRGVSATATGNPSGHGVYAAGLSYYYNVDPVGDRETKGLTFKYPFAGPPLTWQIQTPPPPGAFVYGGAERALGVATAQEPTDTFVYVVGSGQAEAFNQCRFFIAKLDAAGVVLWKATDQSEMNGYQCSEGRGAAVLNGNVYAAGVTRDDGFPRSMLRKYRSSDGALVWTRKATDRVGEYRGIVAFGGAIYAVGSAGPGGSGSDFLIEKWDEAGNRIWSRSYDRGNAEDVLFGITGLGGSLYAAGFTRGQTAGAADGIILEIDPSAGNLLTSTLFGGTGDDAAYAIATDGASLFVAGQAQNPSLGLDAVLLRYSVGGSDTTPAQFTFVDVTGVAQGVLVTSNAITVTGINAPAPVSIVGGSYRINNGLFTTAPGTVVAGNTVEVQHVSGTGSGIPTHTTLTIGGVSDTFTSTTLVSGDITPDPFTFAGQSGVPMSTLVTSNSATISGITVPAAISVIGGEYSIGGGAFTSSPATITNGQAVRVRHMSAATDKTSTSTTLTIGTGSGVFTSVTADAVSNTSLSFVSAHYFGGATDERANAVVVSGNALYLSGYQTSGSNDFDGLVVRYDLPLASGAQPSWSAKWPTLPGEDIFEAVAATREGVYAGGTGTARTTDFVPPKDRKGVMVKYPLSGATDAGFAGSTWEQQVPSVPGAFSYGGIEGVLGMVTLNEGGIDYVYAVGSGQASSANQCRFFIAKVDTGGSTLWKLTDEAEMVGGACSGGAAVTVRASFLYAAGASRDDGQPRPMLRKYDTLGALKWVRKSQGTVGEYRAVAATNDAIYAVGHTGDGEGPLNDFLIEKWDEDGNRLWSRTFDRSSAQDTLRGVVGAGSSIFAVGWTKGGTSGGFDAVILEIDPATGNLLKSTLYGGALDDRAMAVATDGINLYVAGDTRSYGSGLSDLLLLRYAITTGPTTPAALDFGGQAMGTTSPPMTVIYKNTSASTATVASVTSSDPQFKATHDCTSLAPGATCNIQVTFSPAVQSVPLSTRVATSGTLSINTSVSTASATLAATGFAEKSLVSYYYRSILGRAPDEGGRNYWEGEVSRISGLGVSVNEVWYALAMSFFNSPEYAAQGKSNTGFATDLYNTFFNRAPDAGGLSFWVGQLGQGMPREVALAEFMFSGEFRNFTQGIFGSTTSRAEVNMVVDFYRGLLGRVADSGGFASWVGQFRTAQCQPVNVRPAAVIGAVESISKAFTDSIEYANRHRDNSQYVGDLYNGFMRRGGDLAGVLYWIGRLTGANQPQMTRDQLRLEFKQSPEFTARADAVIAQGCLPP